MEYVDFDLWQESWDSSNPKEVQKLLDTTLFLYRAVDKHKVDLKSFMKEEDMFMKQLVQANKDFIIRMNASKDTKLPWEEEEIVIVPEIISNPMDGANDGQLEAFNSFLAAVQSYLKDGTGGNKFSLRGSAGVGKTWLVSKILEELRRLGYSVNMSSPTHKALGVIKKMIEASSLKEEEVSTNTIHSFLNLKLDFGLGDNDDPDKISIKPKLITNPYNQNFINVDILILDESSMVNEELYNLTVQAAPDRLKIVLFVGDEFQLLPVEGGENIIFHREDITHFSLTETVRQKAGSSIINKANEIRDYIKNKNYPKTIHNLFVTDGEIVVCNPADYLQMYFDNPNEKMVGSYTNARVDEYNNYIRYIIKDTLEFLTVGEELVLQDAYTNSSGDPVFQNGEQIILEKVKLIMDVMNGLMYWRCYANEKPINILDPQSYPAYQEKLKTRLDFAKKAKSLDKRKAWQEYFKLKGRYANVKYSFASTIHKLQGSTYQDMYFDMRDLEYFYSKDRDNILRLIYVAITRASNHLYILKD